MEKSGWLLKKSRWIGAWRNRHCSTNPSSREVSFARKVDAKPHIRFSLDAVKTVNAVAANRFRKDYVIQITLTTGQNVYVCATSEQEQSEWMAALSGQKKKDSFDFSKPKITAAESDVVCKELFRYTLNKMIRVPFWYCVEDGFVYTFKLDANKKFVKHNRITADTLTPRQKETLRQPAFANRSFLTSYVTPEGRTLSNQELVGPIFMQFDGKRMHGHLLVFIMPNGQYFGLDDPVDECAATTAAAPVVDFTSLNPTANTLVDRIHALTTAANSSSSSGVAVECDAFPTSVVCLAADLSAATPGEPIYSYFERDAGIFRFCTSYFSGDKNNTRYTGAALSSRQMRIVTAKVTNEYAHKLFHIITPEGGVPQVLFLMGDRFLSGANWMVLCKTDGSLHKFNEDTKGFEQIAPALIDEEAVYCLADGKVISIGDETLYNGPPLSKQQLKVMSENPAYTGELFKILNTDSRQPTVLFVVGVMKTGAVQKYVQMRPEGSLFEFIEGGYREIAGPLLDQSVDPTKVLYRFVDSEDPAQRGIFEVKSNVKYCGSARITQRQIERLSEKDSALANAAFNIICVGSRTQLSFVCVGETSESFNLHWDGSVEKFDKASESFVPHLPAVTVSDDHVEYIFDRLESQFVAYGSGRHVFEGPAPSPAQMEAICKLNRMTVFNIAVEGESILVYQLGEQQYRGPRVRIALVKPDGSIDLTTH